MKRVFPAAAVFVFITWAIVQANKGNDNALFNIVGVIPFGDKIGHMVLFGLLSVVTIVAFKYRTLSIAKRKLPIGAVVVFIFAMTEEVSQLMFINRTFDLMDAMADIVGIYLSIVLVNRYRRLLPP